MMTIYLLVVYLGSALSLGLGVGFNLGARAGRQQKDREFAQTVRDLIAETKGHVPRE
jgi:hypothetical protein